MCQNSYLQTVDINSVLFKLKGIGKKGIGRQKFYLETNGVIGTRFSLLPETTKKLEKIY